MIEVVLTLSVPKRGKMAILTRQRVAGSAGLP